MSDTPSVSIEPHSEVVCVVVHRSELSGTTLDQMQQEVASAATQYPHLPVVLDLTQVIYVPSMGLGAMVMMMRNLKKSDQRFLLVGLQPDVRTVLSITRLDKLFEIHANLEAALSHLHGES